MYFYLILQSEGVLIFLALKKKIKEKAFLVLLNRTTPASGRQQAGVRAYSVLDAHVSAPLLAIL